MHMLNSRWLRSIITKNLFQVPDEAIVKPEEEKPVETTIIPEEIESKDEAEYEQMKSAENDMDGDDNPDLDLEEV